MALRRSRHLALLALSGDRYQSVVLVRPCYPAPTARPRLHSLAAILVIVPGALLGASPVLAAANVSAPGPAPALAFDLAAARQPSDLQLREDPVPTQVPGVRAVGVRFSSMEWATGQARPITLHGYLVRPETPSAPTLPAILVAHGLGAQAELQVAIDLVRTHSVPVLAISAPGLGKSQGRAVTFDDARALYDEGGDLRRSWIYAYVYGVLRAVTLLQSLTDVDPKGIVLAGTSMGAVASLIVNGVDDRVRGVLAASVAGSWTEAPRSGSWLARLMSAATGKPAGDAAALRYFAAFDPLNFAHRQHGAVYLFSGAQDEFFPLPELVTTWRRLRAPAKTLSIVPDWDHQWYFAGGCTAACMPGAPAGSEACKPDPKRSAQPCPAVCPPTAIWPYCGKQASYNRTTDVLARWGLLLRALLDQHGRRPLGPAAPPPSPTVSRRGDEISVRVVGPSPRHVRLAISDNAGYTYSQYRLERGADGRYRHRHPGLSRAALLFAEVENAAGVTATSAPDLPPGFRPVLRPFGERDK